MEWNKHELVPFESRVDFPHKAKAFRGRAKNENVYSDILPRMVSECGST